jgi:hypothetical protein
MRRFWVVLYAVTALVHVPFALGLRHLVELALGARPAGGPGVAIAETSLGGPAGASLATWTASLATIGLVGLLRVPIANARNDRPRQRWRTLLVEEPYFAHWCAALGSALFFLPGLVLVGALSLAGRASAEGSTLRALASGAPGPGSLAAGLYATFLVVSAYGVLVRRRWVRVRTVEVPIAGLAPAFDGYTIAHLSDLHLGSYTPRARAERWRDRVNALGVDLVALTGDYVTSGVAFHRDIAAVLSGFRAKDGTLAVMGNHDYFGDGEPLVELLRAGGVTVLRNEGTSIERGGSRLAIAGVDDTWTRRADVRRAVERRDRSAPLLALAHDPALFPQLAAEGAALVLAGHTHWGQVGVPFLATRFNVSRMTWRYHAGTYTEGGSTLVINPGLGTTGPPVRLGAPPEITLVRLRAASPSDATR